MSRPGARRSDGAERDWIVKLPVLIEVSVPSRAAAIEEAVQVLDEMLDGAALIQLPPVEVIEVRRH